LVASDTIGVSLRLSWLSHLGDATRSLGDERGLMVSDSAYVDYLSDKMITSLNDPSALRVSLSTAIHSE
jgi:hypothetical protein